jgi:hypothetical protein
MSMMIMLCCDSGRLSLYVGYIDHFSGKSVESSRNYDHSTVNVSWLNSELFVSAAMSFQNEWYMILFTSAMSQSESNFGQ